MLRLLSIITILTLCSSCQRDILPSSRIVTFTHADRVIGRGYEISADAIITATHVVRLCERLECNIMSSSRDIGAISRYRQYTRDDLTYLYRGSLDRGDPLTLYTGASLYSIVSRSGSLVRLEGRVTALGVSYISYDDSLSGRVYTGALETDIVFQPGESGSPLWTVSSELAGVVSAVDRERGRSYGVMGY